jgi:hypothetical protein
MTKGCRRFLEPRRGKMCASQVVMRCGKLRIQADGRLILLDCTVEFTL